MKNAMEKKTKCRELSDVELDAVTGGAANNGCMSIGGVSFCPDTSPPEFGNMQQFYQYVTDVAAGKHPW